jgi:hypothetical protein
MLISINYKVSKYLGGSRLAPLFVWIYGGGLLFLNHAYEGYLFGSIFSNLAWMDTYRGLFRLKIGLGIRWQIHFNFSMLRMVSFTMDYYLKRNALKSKLLFIFDSNVSEIDRIEIPLENDDGYDFLNYLTYMVHLFFNPSFIHHFIWQDLL